MYTLKHTSLGRKISNKISSWVLMLVASVIGVIFIVSFALSLQMFNKQINIWKTIVPQQVITNLMDSDHFAVAKEVEFIASTGLFSTFIITDNNKKIIAQFGNNNVLNSNLIPIQDRNKVIWGYYCFSSDFYQFISPFVFAAAIFFILVTLVYFVIRWRIKISLEIEFNNFNNFLFKIEAITEKIHELYQQETSFQIEIDGVLNEEQIIINKAISRLLSEIKKANNSLREAILVTEKQRFQEELTKTALQVAHDIGSPITILEIIQATTMEIPEESRVLLKNAIFRIRDISNTLLQKARKDFSLTSENNLSNESILFVVEQVITEKRIQYGNQIDLKFDFDKNAYKLFSLIKVIELNRIISNLINNSVEAIESDKRINISLMESNNEVLIKIQDFGKGIKKEIINKLGVLGNSFGKIGGTGVGLHHAINSIKEWGGRFEIKSEENKGTIVQVYLLKSVPPSWFVSEIAINNKQIIAIIDDDESIHIAWEKKFKNIKFGQDGKIELIHFYSPQDLITWRENNSKLNNILYLCDYGFTGKEMNGIDLITCLKINNFSILVTNSVDEAVITRCMSETIKLLPKNLAGVVPISEKITV